MGKSGGKLVNKKRVRELKRGKVGDGPVLYWCSRDQRVADNWALIHACETAAATGAPVAVVFSLVTKFLGAGARQFGFMLRGGGTFLREPRGRHTPPSDTQCTRHYTPRVIFFHTHSTEGRRACPPLPATPSVATKLDVAEQTRPPDPEERKKSAHLSAHKVLRALLPFCVTFIFCHP